MAESSIAKPNATTYALEDIVAHVLEGRVRIPAFQRSFRWQWEDVRRLLDSIVRGFPIGSLLLWRRRAEAATLKLGALTIDAPAREEALWVVDGQQRLTSLASAFSDAGAADPRFGIAYDLASGTFTKPKETKEHLVPLPVIFDLQRLLKWLSEHPESAQYFDEATAVAKAIRQYTIPAYIVEQQDEQALREIFDRMNNYGKRLTRAEVFSALHAGDGSEPRNLSDIVDHIDAATGFGRLDEDTVLRAVLARRGPDVNRDIRVEFSEDRVSREFPGETADEAYRRGERAIELAVAFLQNDAGVPHFGFLTYRYLLVLLTRFFAHHPSPEHRNRELLRRWFWRASIVGPAPFSGWTQAMRALAVHIEPDDEAGSVQRLLEAVAPFPLHPPAIEGFRSTAAKSRVILCALWSLGPRSVRTSQPYDRLQLASSLEGRKTAADVVFPILGREPEGWRSSVANRCLLLGEDTDEDVWSRFSSAPAGYDHTTWLTVLRSHAMTEELARLLDGERHIEFLKQRAELLQEVTARFVSGMTEARFEDTPPLDSFDHDEDGVDDEEG